MTFKAKLLALAIAAALAAPLPALAGSLEIGPISVGLIGKERTSTLTLRNTSPEAVNIQIRTADWAQPEGEDVLTPSTTLAASPPFVTLQPGQAQTVRLVVDGVADSATEKSWRLVIDELPPPQAGADTGVVVPIRVLVPVFLAPSLTARPRLVWTAQQAREGVALTVRNTGPVHERLSDLTATAGGRTVSGPDPLYGYILPGQSRTWVLPAGSDSPSIAVKASGAFGPVEGVAPVSR